MKAQNVALDPSKASTSKSNSEAQVENHKNSKRRRDSVTSIRDSCRAGWNSWTRHGRLAPGGARVIGS